MSFYLQRRDNVQVWEEVDFYTWENRTKAIDQSGKPRYSGSSVSKEGTNITVHGDNLTSRDLAVICRFLGVRESEAAGSVGGGFVQKPEFVRFKGRSKIILHEIGGRDFVCKEPKEVLPNEREAL